MDPGVLAWKISEMEGEAESYANQESHPNLGGDEDIDVEQDDDLICEVCELHPEECECPEGEEEASDEELDEVSYGKRGSQFKKATKFAASARYEANPLAEPPAPAKRARVAGKEPRSSLSRSSAMLAPDLFGYFSKFDITPTDAVACARTFANYVCNQERVKNKEKPKRGGYRQYN
jgi:hypothetical protein